MVVEIAAVFFFLSGCDLLVAALTAFGACDRMDVGSPVLEVGLLLLPDSG